MWTKEQLKIINSRKKNIIVSASAGSGKTAVLIERVFNLIIKDKVPIENILMITFTQKAAKEMKERLEQKLNKIILKYPKDIFLKEQAENLDIASISTIHSFCKNIIEDNFQLLEIDLNFRILSETEIFKITDDILKVILEKEYNEKNLIFLKLIETYSKLENDNELKNIIKKFYFFTRSLPDSKKWFNEKIKYFEINLNKFLKNPIGNSFVYFIKNTLKELVILNKKEFLLCKKQTKNKEYINISNEGKNILLKLNDALKSNQWNVFFNITNKGLNRFPSIKKENQIKYHLKFKQIRDAYKLKLKEISFNLFQQLEILGKVKKEIEYLIKLVDNFTEKYSEYKKQKNLLDFNDLEYFAVKLLKNKKIKKYYKKQFEYIFVDEFQDSNFIQEKIIKNISRKNNLFLVGDLKQSIYRFRLADSNIFFQLFKKYIKEKNSEVFSLNKNFRSSKKIINGINSLFIKLMDGHQTSIKYKNNEELIYSSNILNENTIEMFVIDSEEKININNSNTVSEKKMYKEAHICATKINNLIKNNKYIRNNNKKKKLNYSDCAILMYSIKKSLPIYTEVFKKYNIPLYGEIFVDFFNSENVILFFDLLKIINNKNNDLSLINVLKSKLFNFSLKELAKIRFLKSKEKSFYQSFISYSNKKDTILCKKIKNFINILNNFQKEIKYRSLIDFLHYILNETNLYYLFFIDGKGQEEIDNIREILYLAEDYDEKYQDNLRGFLSYCDYLESTSLNTKEINKLPDNENAVKILTLHKSKGLEFPVVFLSNLGNEFKHIKKTFMFMHQKLGIGPIYFEQEYQIKTLSYFIIQKVIEKELIEDYLNLLYVGMSRAKEYLFLIGSVSDFVNKKNKWQHQKQFNYKDMKSFYDIILPLCYFDIDVKKYFKIKETNLDIYKIKKIKQKKINLNDQKINIDKDAFINIPIVMPKKISVTELSNSKENFILAKDLLKNDLKIKPNFIENISINSLEKGILFHLVMEKIDFKKIKNRKDIELYIEYLKSKKILSEMEIKIIKIDEILAFIESPLAERIRKSIYFEKEKSFNYILDPKIFCKEYNGNENILLQGIIDLYFKENDGYVIIDFKTDYLTEKTLRSKINLYKSQIFLYAKALEEIKKIKVKETYIYFASIKKIILIKRQEKLWNIYSYL